MLKIGDFGMATSYPAVKGIEREGDREYIAPEVLSCQQYDKPADIFSLGIMMLEIAANIVLPDNGIHWQKLRSGDLTDAGRLSSGDLHYADEEDEEEEEEEDEDDRDSDSDLIHLSMDNDSRTSLEDEQSIPPLASSQNSSNNNKRQRRRDLSSSIPSYAPSFMTDNSGALDQMVKWMLYPKANDRPTANQILMSEECQWVEAHRKAGAVIYEGDYGPAPDEEGRDSEMLQDDEADDWRRGV